MQGNQHRFFGGTHIYSGNIGEGGIPGLIHNYRWVGGIPLYVSNSTSHLACKNQIDNKSLARHGGYLFLKVQKIWHIRSNEIIVVID